MMPKTAHPVSSDREASRHPCSLRSWGANAALAAVLLAAVAVPRGLTLGEVELSAPFVFSDMILHLYNVDLLHKVDLLGEQALGDPFFRANPAELAPQNPAALAPAVYQVARLWVGAWGPLGLWTTQATNFIFLTLMLGGVVGLGAALWGLRVGLLAGLLTALCPALVASSWYFSSDFPLAAVTTVGMLLLLWTRSFSRALPSVVLGAWVALASMVKITCAAYLLAPALAALALGLLAGSVRPWRVAAHAGAAAAVCLALLLALHADGLAREWHMLMIHLQPGQLVPGMEGYEAIPTWSIRGLLSVPIMVAMNYSLPLLVAALPGLVAIHRSVRARPVHPGRLLLVAFIWGVVLFNTLLPHRQERYCLPLYPVLCLVTAWWVSALARAWHRRLAVSGAAALFVLALAVAHLYPDLWTWDPNAWPNTGNMEMPGRHRLEALRTRPTEPDPACKLGPMADGIVSLAAAEGSHRVLGVTSTLPLGTRSELAALMAAQRLPRRVVMHLELEHRPAESLPAALIVIHGPDQPPGHLPGRRVRRTVRASLTCNGEVTPLSLSLVIPEATRAPR